MRRTLPPDDDQISAALQSLADVRYKQGRNADAEPLYREALAVARRRHGNTGPMVAARLAALGTFLGYTGRPADGEPLLREALALRRAAYGEAHPPEVLSVLITLGDVTRYERRFAESEVMMRDALPVARTIFGTSHPMIANVESRSATCSTTKASARRPSRCCAARSPCGWSCSATGTPTCSSRAPTSGRFSQSVGRFPDADSLFTAALRARREELGPTSPAVAASLNDLGYLAKLQSKWTEAEQRYREAMPIWKAADIVDEQLNAQAEIGWALLKQEQFDEAESMLNDALAQRKARYGDMHFLVGDAYREAGADLRGRRDFAKAESLTMSGLEIRRTVFGPKAIQVGGQLQERGLPARGAGRHRGGGGPAA